MKHTLTRKNVLGNSVIRKNGRLHRQPRLTNAHPDFKRITDMFIDTTDCKTEIPSDYFFHTCYFGKDPIPIGQVYEKIERENTDRVGHMKWSKEKITNEAEKLQKEYLKEYKESKRKVKRALDILSKTGDEIYFERICPLTKLPFDQWTGNELYKEAMTHSRVYKGFHITHDKLSVKLPAVNDKRYDLYGTLFNLDQLYHPEIIQKIKNEWNMKPIEPTFNMKDKTVLSIDVIKGKMNILYNKGNPLLYTLTLYMNTKGIHYKPRGKTPVYPDFPDIEIDTEEIKKKYM